MATFEGTLKEFHDYIGPRIRNKINHATTKLRSSYAKKCQHCSEENELESAHIHEHGGRKKIIETVLQNHAISEMVFNVNLKTIEKEILDAHQPLENHFLFLCKPCHKEYDRKHGQSLKPPAKKTSRPTRMKKENRNKINRIELWATRPGQINHKAISAFLTLSKNNNPVSLKDFEAACRKAGIRKEQFSGNFNSMKTNGGNSHGYVFNEDDGFVHIQPEAWKLIERFWPRGAK